MPLPHGTYQLPRPSGELTLVSDSRRERAGWKGRCEGQAQVTEEPCRMPPTLPGHLMGRPSGAREPSGPGALGIWKCSAHLGAGLLPPRVEWDPCSRAEMHCLLGHTSGSFKQSWALLLGGGPMGICVHRVTHLLELGFPRLDRPYLYFFKNCIYS